MGKRDLQGYCFRPKLELICLGLAVPFLVASLFELLDGSYAFGFSHLAQFRTTQIIYLLSFGAVHVYLTIFMLLSFPELKKWVRETRIIGLPFPLHVFLLWILFFLIAFWGGSLFARPANWLIFYTMIFFMYVVRLHHGLAQVQGISQIYNHSEKIFSATKDDFARFLKREKIAFTFLKGGVLGGLSIYIFAPMSSPAILLKLSQFLFWGGLLASFYIIYNAYKHRQAGGWKKLFFLTRVFLYSLQFYSFIAAIGSLFTHSIEYFMVVDKMTINSSVETKKRKRLYLYVLISIVPIFSFTLFRYIYINKLSFLEVKSSLGHLETFKGGGNLLFLTLIALNFSFDFVHYYMDRVIFRMRSETSYKYTAPLVRGVWSSKGVH